MPDTGTNPLISFSEKINIESWIFERNADLLKKNRSFIESLKFQCKTGPSISFKSDLEVRLIQHLARQY